MTSAGTGVVLCDENDSVTRAIGQVLATCWPVSVRITEWGAGGGSYEALKAALGEESVRVVVVDVSEVPDVESSALREVALDRSTTTPVLFVARISHDASCDSLLLAPTIGLTDAGAFQLALAHTLLSRRTNVTATACHRVGNHLLNILNQSSTSLGDRARAILASVEGFAKPLLGGPGDDPLGAFFHRFVTVLKRAAEAPSAKDELEVRDYCEALREYNFQHGRPTGDPPTDKADEICPKETTRTVAIREKIKATVLIVEDDQRYAAELQSYFNSRRNDHARFVLDVQLHVPKGRETAVKFRERLVNRISCSDNEFSLEHLQAAIIDHSLGGLVDQPTESPLTGVTLGRDIARLRPGTNLILLTGGDILGMIEEIPGLFNWTVSKHDPSRIEWQELLAQVLSHLQKKYHTPFWNALYDFASKSILTFHAPAVAHVRSAKRSGVLDDFVDFYKDPYFHAETSATIGGLDNLLHPKGSIKSAQELAARAFGSERTLFVTNGTSTANKIVLQALLRPGDLVLVDRNCHISHHYAMALAGAQPYYLEPEQLPAYGISTGVPIDSIVTGLKTCLGAGKQPAAILLTNCTFDGIISNPEHIIGEVKKVLGANLSKTAFVFDEAWFAFARFHPRFIGYTGMAAAKSLKEGPEADFYDQHLRVYVTQSTHKTLSAFRQGSMIHMIDPVLRTSSEARGRLDEAFLTHTTTSPHSGIIASLDVARRQAELEGCALVHQTIALAEEFRNQFTRSRKSSKAWDRVLETFSVLDAADLISVGARKSREFDLDPTKITLHIRTGPSGDELKALLMEDYGIQVNKTSHNTVLLMFHIGTTTTAQANLKNVLMEIERGNRPHPAPKRPRQIKLPSFSGFWKGNPTGDLASFFHNVNAWPVVMLPISGISNRVRRAAENIIAASFVTPYPPGYPVLVPGQVIDLPTARFLESLKSRTIHGSTETTKGVAIPVFLQPAAGPKRRQNR